MRRLLILAGPAIFFAPMLCAHDVALRNGTVVHFQSYGVVNNELFYNSPTGEQRVILLTDINFNRTRELSRNDNPPLDIDGLIAKMNAARRAPAPPLGDVARQLNAKPTVNADGRVFTNDDFPASPVLPAAAASAAPEHPVAGLATGSSDWPGAKARIERFINKTAGLTEQQYAARMLGPGLAAIEFPRRSEWQARIYAQHQKYLTDAELCISGRVSDAGSRQDAACRRLDDDKYRVQSLGDEGKQHAQEWKSRQEKFVEQ